MGMMTTPIKLLTRVNRLDNQKKEIKNAQPDLNILIQIIFFQKEL